MKKILFISGIDFKEKSIQVIRKTPEAYVRHGWEVHYLVGRDGSRNGDYFYEPIINPHHVKIYRFWVPLAFLDGLWNNAIWKAVIFRFRNFFLWLLLTVKAIKLIRNNQFDVLYGYEMFGVLAVRFARFLGYGRRSKFVIRFQGVYAGEWERKGQWFRGIANWDYFLALKTTGDLCIMTNDGTKGTALLQRLGNKTKKVLFFVNGVDEVYLNPTDVEAVKHKFFNEPAVYFMSVSRLVPQKRVDRSIRIMHRLVKQVGITNVRYNILGSGAEEENLKKLILDLKMEDYITLVGSVKNEDVKNFMACSDFFFSMDTISNVGNPLLEAIRSNKLIITLNNGDTASWIHHRVNGLIYDVLQLDLTENDYIIIAQDVAEIIADRNLFNKMKEELLITNREKLWTWEKRMTEEIRNVEKLVSND